MLPRGGLRDLRPHDQAVAVFHQRMAHEAKNGPGTPAVSTNVATTVRAIAGLLLPVFSGETNSDDIHLAIREFGEDRRLPAVAKGAVAAMSGMRGPELRPERRAVFEPVEKGLAPRLGKGNPAHSAQMTLMARKIPQRPGAQYQFPGIHRKPRFTRIGRP